ncbi:MAG: carbon monoxide dehydrogenase subunit G [Silicimonas sp.]|nr:carbon monoxide dehydrogenase subunit G [Silicimonas sp.]
MKLSEERVIAASPEKVWSGILDAEVLRECIPGCQELTGNPDDGFDAVVVQKVGPVKATFKGTVTLSNVEPGKSCRLSGAGKGGAAGFAKGAATVTLEPEGDGTRLTYDVDASVGGKLAQLGSRIIDSFSKKLADQFFTRFQEVMETR